MEQVRGSSEPNPEGPLMTREEVLEWSIERALNELGVPGPGYPAPVANAVEILRGALGR